MSAVVNCPHCAFFARVTREKCFCWQVFRDRRTLCIISCFFKQCEKQCEIFPPQCVFTELFTVHYSMEQLGGGPEAQWCYLPGSNLLELPLSVHQHTLSTVWALPASTFFTGTLLTKLEKEIRLQETQIVRGIIMPKVIYFIQ